MSCKENNFQTEITFGSVLNTGPIKSITIRTKTLAMRP